MRYYGGLRKHIPITFWTMMAGTLAITGVGVADVFGFAGYYSKDAIIEAAFASGAKPAFGIGVFVAAITSFYSWRLMFLTFWGKPRWAGSEHIQHALHDAHGHGDDHGHAHDAHHAAHPDTESAGHDEDPHHAAEMPATGTGGYHPHESPWVMLVPLLVLAVGAVFSGWWFHNIFIDATASQNYWHGAVAFHDQLVEAMEKTPFWWKQMATLAWVTGLVIAVLCYLVSPGFPATFASHFELLYKFLLNKWYFDEIYHVLFVKPAFWIGRLFWKGGDEGTIDRFGPNGSATAVRFGAVIAAKLQSGYVYTYAFVMLIGLTAAVTWVIAR
jgi:NADH-quinone oxidoreductase subunit L